MAQLTVDEAGQVSMAVVSTRRADASPELSCKQFSDLSSAAEARSTNGSGGGSKIVFSIFGQCHDHDRSASVALDIDSDM